MGIWQGRAKRCLLWLLTSRIAWMVAVGVVSCAAGRDAQAHQRDFPFTYDWYQADQGEKEIELQSLYRASDSSFQQQVEFEYGISSRFMVAPYLDFDRMSGGKLHYSGFKVESRYQLGDFAAGRILPGLYLEYEQPNGETGEMEGKLIFSRYDRAGGDLSLNLITERPFNGGSSFRNTYAFGYARPLGFSRYRPRVGLEWIRDIDDGRVNAGPVLAFAPGGRTWAVAGYGFPINHRGSNGGELRLLLEYEWD